MTRSKDFHRFLVLGLEQVVVNRVVAISEEYLWIIRPPIVIRVAAVNMQDLSHRFTKPALFAYRLCLSTSQHKQEMHELATCVSANQAGGGGRFHTNS